MTTKTSTTGGMAAREAKKKVCVMVSLAAAAMTIVLNDVALWIIAGALAAVVTGRLMRGGNILVDILIGAVGAVALNLIVHYFSPDVLNYGFWGAVVVAIIGAVLLVAIERLLTSRRRSSTTTTTA